jgi:uncharacterized membrane protein YjjP (DUF1212 family)
MGALRVVESTHNDSSDRAEMLTLIAEVGDALNRSSYPNPETGKVIREICDAYDYDISAEVFPTYVLALDQKEGLTELVNTGPSFRFDQVADTETLVHRLRLAALPVGEALTQLRAIVAAKPPVNAVARIIGYMLMALGFALCFRMSLGASIAAVVIAIPIAAISLWSSVKGTLAALMPVLLTFISALAITLWALHQGFPDPVRVAVIPVLTLIPGAALTTALIELTAGAMISGSARLVYALVVLLSMAFGLALAIDLVGIGSRNLQDLTTNQAPSWVLWIAPLIFGLGNILYFCPPRRVWFWLVVVAFGTFWINQGLQQVMKPAFAGGVALGIALLVAWAINAHVKGNPSVLVMFLPTFWLMVPGSMGFVAISGAITEDRELSDLGGSAALSLLSMAICMMVASVLAPMVTRRYKAPSAG